MQTSQTSQISVRLPKTLYTFVEYVADEMGVSLQDAVRMLLGESQRYKTWYREKQAAHIRIERLAARVAVQEAARIEHEIARAAREVRHIAIQSEREAVRKRREARQAKHEAVWDDVQTKRTAPPSPEPLTRNALRVLTMLYSIKDMRLLLCKVDGMANVPRSQARPITEALSKAGLAELVVEPNGTDETVCLIPAKCSDIRQLLIEAGFRPVKFGEDRIAIYGVASSQ